MHGSGTRRLLLIGTAALLAAAGVAYLALAPGSRPQRYVQSAENLSFEFDPMVVDLGEIPLGETRSAQVRIRNIAADPREITVAAPSCACTKATWPEDPVPVGGTAESTVSQTPTGAVGEVVKKTVAYVILSLIHI